MILLWLFALLNAKMLPLGWHMRLVSALLRALRASKRRIETQPGPATLFIPIMTSSRTSILECDYNGHKSNSTYFADFDVGRLELMVRLLSVGIENFDTSDEKKNDSIAPSTIGGFPVTLSSTNVKTAGLFDVIRNVIRKKEPGKAARLTVPLAGVLCNFHREIKPGARFEVYTRILTWDTKWLFIIGHFVKPGTVTSADRARPYQPWEETGSDRKEGVVHASALAKYCFKSGRLTVPPERVLATSRLLPRSDDDNPPDGWTAQRVEGERRRGMGIAELYMGLDRLRDEFVTEQVVQLGWH